MKCKPSQDSFNNEILAFLCSSFHFVIGGGGNMSDFTYVENVAHANICAEQALCSNAASVAGKVHFYIKGLYIRTATFIINSVH